MEQVNLDVAGHVVEAVTAEYLLDIAIDDDWGFQAEAGLEITTAGTTTTLRAEDLAGRADVLDALGGLVGTAVTSFDVLPGGAAVLVVGATTVVARPDPVYESWNIVGPRKERIVCNAGGSLSEWPPE